MLILAFFLAAYLVWPIDSFTLRATRGAAGAIGGAIRPTRSSGGSTRSTRAGSTRPRTRSSGRSAGKSGDRSKSAGSVPIDPPRPSRLGQAIRGWIRSADRAEARRADLLDSIRILGDRRRARKQDRQARRIAIAEDRAHDENDRRDRAAERDRIREGVKQIAAQIPDLKEKPVSDLTPLPARGDQFNGAYRTPDLTHINLTELDTLDQLYSEVGDANHLVGRLAGPVDELHAYLRGLSERYAGARDLWKTLQMNACVALLDERNFNALRNELDKAAEQLETFMKAIEKAEGDVKESDARTGRVESARAN